MDPASSAPLPPFPTAPNDPAVPPPPTAPPIASPVPAASPAAPVGVAPSLFEAAPKKKRFPVSRIIAMIIGTLIGIPLMLVGFLAIQGALFTRASDSAPRDLVVAATTETTATIHWTTDQETQAVVQYGTDPAELRFFAPETSDGRDHTLTVELLQPGTTYYFTVKIGSEVFDNGGEPWIFTTKGGTPATDTGTTDPGATGSATPDRSEKPARTCPITNDCDVIRERLGKGCTTTEFVRCLNPTPTP